MGKKMGHSQNTSEYDVTAGYEDFNEPSLTTYEKMIFVLMLLGLFSVFLIALWSSAIVFLDAAAEKAPIALLMRIIPIHLLL